MLIFLDIDGTLVMPGQPLSEATVAAIHAARANGHKVFLSTGRSEASAPDSVRAIGFDGAIYSAGGRAVVGGEEILNQPMPEALARRSMDALSSAGLVFTLECAHDNYQSADMPSIPEAFDISGAGSEVRRIWEQFARNQKRAADYRGEPIYKISLMATAREQIEALRARLGNAAKVVAFGNLMPDLPLVGAEISDPSVSKGTALERICAYLHADPSDCVAFGDSMNDAEILRAAGTGVAMDNAEDAVKAIADRVCESCWDEGVAKELARMNLI